MQLTAIFVCIFMDIVYTHTNEFILVAEKIHYQEIKHFSIWRSGKNICFFFPKLMDMENKQWSFSWRWLIFCHFSYEVKLLTYFLLSSSSFPLLGILRPVNTYCKIEAFHELKIYRNFVSFLVENSSSFFFFPWQS